MVRLGNQIFRFLTAVPKGSDQLAPTSDLLRQTFRRITPEEAKTLKPLRVRVVTVGQGDTLASLSARMMGTDRKLELFKVLNAIPAGQSPALGSRVKIVSE